MISQCAVLPSPALVAACALAALAAGAAGCRDKGGGKSGETSLRLGFFPNLTHGPALVGLQRGDFARALAPRTVDAKPFNAGPEAMEALFAGALDACFVGPAPAINGYLRSHGEALVVVSGAALNGAGLVVRKEAGIHAPADLHGKKVASPQLGNTQDVALRDLSQGERAGVEGSRRRRAGAAAGQRRHPGAHEAEAARRRLGARAVDRRASSTRPAASSSSTSAIAGRTRSSRRRCWWSPRSSPSEHPDVVRQAGGGATWRRSRG